MFYYKEVIKLIAESINFHVDTIMFKLFKTLVLPAILFTAYAGFPMLNAKQHAIQKLKSQLLVLDSVALPWLFVCYKANNQIFILEKSNDVGGTWRENRYPGAACDVQSHMYSLSFAPKTDWSKRYAEAPEIFDYIQDITNQYQIKTTVSLTMRLLMYSMMKCAMYGH